MKTATLADALQLVRDGLDQLTEDDLAELAHAASAELQERDGAQTLKLVCGQCIGGTRRTLCGEPYNCRHCGGRGYFTVPSF